MTNINDTPENQIARAIAAKTPIIYVVSWEEERLARMLCEASFSYFEDKRPIWQW
ncbi:MAG: hypothetical protein GY712_02405, partial [Oceanicoccus sp.]|nr:hypothetical protein [Oceanicoccus sp.]